MVKQINLCSWFIGIDGGFDNNEPEYAETYNIVILPNYVALPFPSVELPEKVLVLIFLKNFNLKEQILHVGQETGLVTPYKYCR